VWFAGYSYTSRRTVAGVRREIGLKEEREERNLEEEEEEEEEGVFRPCPFQKGRVSTAVWEMRTVAWEPGGRGRTALCVQLGK